VLKVLGVPVVGQFAIGGRAILPRLAALQGDATQIDPLPVFRSAGARSFLDACQAKEGENVLFFDGREGYRSRSH